MTTLVQIDIEPTFEDWQRAARAALQSETPPHAIAWSEKGDQQAGLDLFLPSGRADLPDHPSSAETAEKISSSIRVPRQFIETAKLVARHRDPAKWPLLYRVLWRLTHDEPHLLQNPADVDATSLRHLEKEVSRDGYRMRQYIRFRETTLDGAPWFVAWYEPDHDTVGLNKDFFADRFANMRWSILTPIRCMHWDGQQISLSAGVEKSAAPTGDDVEPLWISYYSRIFNPARVKVRAMKAQMPVRNWRNLPEARVIAPILQDAPRRVQTMLERSQALQVQDSEYGIATPPATADLNELKRSAEVCKACPLWKMATCTVFGEGPVSAQIVVVGEQPGDQEDRAARPFVGPAGHVFDRALAEAGVERRSLYVTNAVKHFKWEPRGKRRIHKTPSARDITACRPWLEAELRAIQPKLIVALGATAARSLFNTTIKVTEERGNILDSPFGPTLITVHPSSLLRMPPGVDPEPEFRRFVADLTLLSQGR